MAHGGNEELIEHCGFSLDVLSAAYLRRNLELYGNDLSEAQRARIMELAEEQTPPELEAPDQHQNLNELAVAIMHVGTDGCVELGEPTSFVWTTVDCYEVEGTNEGDVCGCATFRDQNTCRHSMAVSIVRATDLAAPGQAQ